MTTEPVVEAALAKINLALHVTGRRADGYHNLESLVAFAGVGDELEAVVERGQEKLRDFSGSTARPISNMPADSLKVSGPFAKSLGSGETNLVTRAVAAFRARWPAAITGGLALTLRKNLPVAAGLGGGSADAAAALRLLTELSAVPIPAAELSALALTLGADVPACLLSRPCEIRGVGEIVTPLASFPACHVVLVNPLVPVVTADVFRRLQSRDNPGLPGFTDPLTRPAQLGIWLGETRNDLEPPAIALVPAIGEIIAAVGKLDGCILARMSGSGATVFGLFGTASGAHQAAHDLRERWPGYWVAAAPLVGA